MAELPRFQRSVGVPNSIGGQGISARNTPAGRAAVALGTAAQGVGEFGAELDRIQATKETAWISRATGEAEIAAADMEQRLESESTEGAPGHAEKARAEFKKYTAGVMGMAPSSRAREALGQRLFQQEVRIAKNAGAFQANAELTKRAADFDIALNAHISAAARGGDLASGDATLDDDFAGASAWLPADQITRLRASTRERMAGGFIGNLIEKNPSQALAILESGQMDERLSPEKSQTLIRATKSELRRRAAEGRAAAARKRAEYMTGFADYAAFIAAGNAESPDAQYTEESLALVLGDQAGGAIEALRDARRDGNINTSIRSASPEDLVALRDELVSKAEVPDDFVDNAQAVATFDRLYAARNKELAADPVGFIIATNPEISQAISEADTPEDYQAALDAAEAEQDRLGVPKRLQKPLPNDLASSTVAGIGAMPSEEQGGALLGLMSQAGGHSSKVAAQLKSAGLPTGLFHAASNWDNPGLAQELIEATIRSAEIKNALPKGVDTDNRDKVATELAEFSSAMLAGDFTGSNAELVSEQMDTISNLANLYSLRGESNAAQKAYDAVIGNQTYVGLFGGTGYAPKAIKTTYGLKALDDSEIERAADNMQTAGVIKNFNPVPFGDLLGGSFAELDATRTLGAALHSGKWVTDTDGLGAVLMVPLGDGRDLPLRNAQGEFFRFKFEDANKIAGQAANIVSP